MNNNNQTPKNASSFKELVDSDKRSILERVLNASIPTPKPTNVGSPSSSEKDGSTCTQNSDYDAIFGEDVDDSEELFANILIRAKEEFEKQKELKKKYPNLEVIQDIFKKPKNPKNTRKRTKTKDVENSLAIMNNFKKKLIEPPKQSHTLPTKSSTNNICSEFKSSTMISSRNGSRKFKSSTMISSSNDYNQFKPSNLISTTKDYSRFKSSIKTLLPGNQTQQKPYPTWKTTETYTPIFSATTNPNWANLHNLNMDKMNPTTRKYSPTQKKLYTPGHINNWMDTATNIKEPPSCKTIRSDVAVYDSDSDDDCIKSVENTSIYFSPKFNSVANKISSIGFKTPPTKKTINSSTPMKSTTVHFKPSPPDYFVYGSDGNSSISSDPMFTEENENNDQIDSLENYNGSYQGDKSNFVSPPNSPFSLQNGHFPCKKNIKYEEHHRIFSSSNHPNKVERNLPNDTMEEPTMFVEDFVRKLNYNISNNYNMELKYSMKVKYYS